MAHQFDIIPEGKAERVLLHSLRLLQKPQSLHFLVVINPALEAWLLECATRCGIESKAFPTVTHLKSVTKDLRVVDNPEFRKFLQLLFKSEKSGLRTLKSWIEQLRDQYAW